MSGGRPTFAFYLALVVVIGGLVYFAGSKAGLFGDILLGIAGAFILETLLPSSVSVMEATEFEGSAVAATGIIGGYGGRAIIKFSLERFFKYTGALDEVRAATILEQQQRRYGASTADARAESSASGGDIASGGASTLPQAEDRAESESTLALIERVYRYVQQGVAAPEQAQLGQQLQADSAPVRQAILSAMVELKAEVGDDLDAAQLQRMATIFEGLASVSPNDHALYYQLALAHSAQMPPVYGEALAGLNQAIALCQRVVMHHADTHHAVLRQQAQSFDQAQGVEMA